MIRISVTDQATDLRIESMIGGVVNDLGIDNVGVVLIINGKLSFGTIPTWTAMFVSLGVRTTLCGDANDFQWAIHDLYTTWPNTFKITMMCTWG